MLFKYKVDKPMESVHLNHHDIFDDTFLSKLLLKATSPNKKKKKGQHFFG